MGLYLFILLTKLDSELSRSKSIEDKKTREQFTQSNWGRDGGHFSQWIDRDKTTGSHLVSEEEKALC